MRKLFHILFFCLAFSCTASAQQSQMVAPTKQHKMSKEYDYLDLSQKQKKALKKLKVEMMTEIELLRERGEFYPDSPGLVALRDRELKTIEAILDERQKKLFRENRTAAASMK